MAEKYVMYDHTFDDIDAQPTVDAVPVVRCKDCIYHKRDNNESESWNLCGFYRPWLYRPTGDEKYCSDGVRRKE